MKIDLNEITVRDLVEDYHDDGEGGVRGYGGKLDIRPARFSASLSIRTSSAMR